MKRVQLFLVFVLALGFWTAQSDAARKGNEKCATENRAPQDCAERMDGVYEVTQHRLSEGSGCDKEKRTTQADWLKSGKYSHFRLVYEGEDEKKTPLLSFRECKDKDNCSASAPKDTNWEYNEKRGTTWYFRGATATETPEGCKIKITHRQTSLHAWGSNERAFIGHVTLKEKIHEGTTKAIRQYPCDISKVENLEKWSEYYMDTKRTSCVRFEEIAGKSVPSKFEDWVEG